VLVGLAHGAQGTVKAILTAGTAFFEPLFLLPHHNVTAIHHIKGGNSKATLKESRLTVPVDYVANTPKGRTVMFR
jgi:hypothetical protein